MFQLVNNCYSITREKNSQNLNPNQHFLSKKQNVELLLDRGESQYWKHKQDECSSKQNDRVLHQVNGL